MKQIFLRLLLFLLISYPLQAYNSSWGDGTEDFVRPPSTTSKSTPESNECKPNACCMGGGATSGSLGAKTGSPVYLQTGKFTWSTVDVALADSPNLILSRSYTAFDPHSGLFGNSWLSNFEKLFLKTIKYSKDETTEETKEESVYILRQADGSRFAYKYDENNNSFIDLGGLRVKAKKLNAEDVVLSYPSGTKETYHNGYLSKRENSYGESILLDYDATRHLTKIQSPHSTLNLSYNSNGYVSLVTDHRNRSWQYFYDENGNLIEVINPQEASTTYSYQRFKPQYDAHISYLIHTITDATDRNIIEVSYDSEGRVATYSQGAQSYSYSYVNSTTVRKTDIQNNSITYTLDDKGFITKVADPLGAEIRESYDASTKKTQTVDARGKTWARVQDEMGRTIASADPLSNQMTYTYEGNNTKPSTITTPLGYTTTITYDAKQNPLTVTDAKGNTQSFKYDSKGNATEITDAKGNKTTIAYNSNNQPTSITNALGYTTTIAYDAQRRQQSITDAEGRTTTYEYDAMDRIVKTTDAIGNTIEYSYDKAGRLLSLTDPVGNGTTYIYDSYGRVSTETRADGGVTRYAYNTDNTIKTITRRDGKTVSYAYDAAKRPISQSVDGDTISYTYDAEGNILTATNTSGTVSFAYDETGKLTKETQLGIDILTSYDKDSNVKTLSFLNKTVNYSRDALGLATSINNNTFTYDKNSIQTKLDYPNSTSETNTFDAVYNIKKIQTANQTLNYTQDKTGLIKSKNSTNYTYDNIGRLTQAGSDSFTYDKAGNNQNNNAVYNLLNNQLKQSDLFTITYDGMGNIKTKYNKLTKKTTIYTFNARNQLTQYVQQDENNNTTKTLSYTYDAFNRRVSKTEDNTTQKYLYDGDDIVAILDNANQVIATITHDERIDTPLSITNANGTFYYHRDHQGSIVALTDSTGEVVESFTYDNHYGTITNHTITTQTNNPYAYTGRELDTEELYYYRARYYDPTLQRFLSEDPIGFDGGDFNFYGYTWNNPINYTDSSGLIIDTFADIGFMLYDVYSIGRDNIFGNCDNFGTNLAALGADSLAMLIPGVTGGGMAVRAGTKGTKVVGKITGYTKHGLNQAISRNEGRGVGAKHILDAVKNPKKIITQSGGRIKYKGKNATVILNQDGEIITTYGKSRGEKIWDWGKQK